MQGEVVEEHSRVAHPALCSGAAKTFVHLRSINANTFAVLDQIHATLRFVEIEFPIRRTHGRVDLLIYFAELDVTHAYLAKPLRQHKLNDRDLLDKSR